VIDAVNGVVERTYGSSGQGEKDETLVRVQQEFRERNLRNDERRLLFLLQGVSYDTKEMSFTPLELERLTLDLDGNGHARGEVVTPGELLSKRVLVPHKELINYWHEKSIPMRLYPIGHCMNQRISLKRTGCDDASASALYTVGIYHGDGQYALHLPMSVSVSQDQEDLWLAMLDDNLRELVQRPLSHYAQDPLVTTQQGTMKMPLVSVEEEGSVRRFEVTCLGAGVRTFNQRVLTAEDRRSLHFSAAEVAALSVTEPVHPLDPPETYPWDLH
jgi:hypothetical protein